MKRGGMEIWKPDDKATRRCNGQSHTLTVDDKASRRCNGQSRMLMDDNVRHIARTRSLILRIVFRVGAEHLEATLFVIRGIQFHIIEATGRPKSAKDLCLGRANSQALLGNEVHEVTTAPRHINPKILEVAKMKTIALLMGRRQGLRNKRPSAPLLQSSFQL